MHFGWEAYSHYYLTSRSSPARPEEHLDVLSQLKKRNLGSWGLANGLAYARKVGEASRVLEFNYGRIEAEPSFPMTNFSPELAYEAGRGFGAPRGAIGNAQTHCLQLPNTFAFARGAAGKPVADADFIAFAEDLVPGHGGLILRAWQALAGEDPRAMLETAREVEKSAPAEWNPGRLKGLLFGDAARLGHDLVLQLRLKAAYHEFLAALHTARDFRAPFERFVATAETWQKRHGYQCAWRTTRWHWRDFEKNLARLKSPAIDAVLRPQWKSPEGWERVKERFYLHETATTRLMEAMKSYLRHDRQ
jgi:hypothetical protein